MHSVDNAMDFDAPLTVFANSETAALMPVATPYPISTHENVNM